MRYWTTLWLAGMVACTGGQSEPAPPPIPEAPAPAPVSVAPVPEGARVFFVEPADKAKVPSTFTVKFGVDGMEVKPAGELVEGTGHHHLIIGPAGIEVGKQVPTDEKHIHYGKGQTETELTLTPGEYDLTLQFADGMHMSYGPPMSATIHVTVE